MSSTPVSRSLLIDTILQANEANRRREAGWDTRLSNWERPASDSEEATIERAARMVRDALNTNPWFDAEGVTIEPQGSYHNNTNVRQQADMDIRAVHPLMQIQYATNVTPLARAGTGYYDVPRTLGSIAQELRAQVQATLEREFGRGNVEPGNKAFRISSVPNSRSDIDVVPALTYRYVHMAHSPFGFGTAQLAELQGISIFGRDGSITQNFPHQHHANGIRKRTNTAQRFKKVVRTLKSLRDDLVTRGVLEQGQISSFLIESLVYCVEDEHFLVEESRYARLKRILGRLNAQLANPEWAARALEVNDVKLLFSANQSWTVAKAQHFVRLALTYLEV